MPIKYLSKSTIKNKTVLLRVDVNVPIEHGKVADAFRIEQIIPTINLLRENGNKIILCGHLGRPKGKEAEFSLKPVGEKLANMLGLKFVETDHKVPDYAIPHLILYTGNIAEEKHQQQLQNIQAKDIVLLENLRFNSGEEENDPVFAKKLASLGEVYVNDAFGVDHRAAASVSAITKYITSYAGLLLEKEIKGLDEVLHKAKSPFVLMTGGIKISDKIATIEHLGKKADKILVSGGIASLFFLAKGFEIGKSKVEAEAAPMARILEKNFKSKIILPLDVVVANENMDKSSIRVCAPYEVGPKEMMLDIGPKTILAFAKELKIAKTIVWNGPLGHFEVKPFDMATMALARVVGGVASRKAFVVVGGGETVDVLRHSHQFEHIDHVSTGGGAMLEYLAGKDLPGIEALK
ncbi:MAG: phosphoglycerate kinase [Candidatus Doudnabacteria bacterium]|nr:phosphoglycerate kinase [Candidatus Doudnabacteria bacterium]